MDDDRSPDQPDRTVAWEPGQGMPVDDAAAQRIEGAFAWALVVERGPRAGLTYVLPAGETSAGRDADSEIFLGDVTVSRRHARFTVDDGGLRVEDLGSTNGTYVNGKRVDAYLLSAGDEVMIGKYMLLVVEGNR